MVLLISRITGCFELNTNIEICNIVSYTVLSVMCWTFDTFEDNFGSNHKFAKYLNECCVLDFDQDFSFKYFLKIVFVPEISAKKSFYWWFRVFQA